MPARWSLQEAGQPGMLTARILAIGGQLKFEVFGRRGQRHGIDIGNEDRSFPARGADGSAPRPFAGPASHSRLDRPRSVPYNFPP